MNKKFIDSLNKTQNVIKMVWVDVNETKLYISLGIFILTNASENLKKAHKIYDEPLIICRPIYQSALKRTRFLNLLRSSYRRSVH